MNWEMISAVGQMLGAIGVIISIIYLAVQNPQSKQGKPARSDECFDDALERFE
jgi:hypothetical protein